MSVKMASKTLIRLITQDEKREGKTLIIILFLFSLAAGPLIRSARNNGRYFPAAKKYH